jgi:hypothetical protein
MDTTGIRVERASRQKVVRFQEPDQFRRPSPSLFHFPGVSEGEGFR